MTTSGKNIIRPGLTGPMCPHCGGQAFKLTGTRAAYWCLNPMCGKLFVLTEAVAFRISYMRKAMISALNQPKPRKYSGKLRARR